jgi:hypothetical protein
VLVGVGIGGFRYLRTSEFQHFSSLWLQTGTIALWVLCWPLVGGKSMAMASGHSWSSMILSSPMLPPWYSLSPGGTNTCKYHTGQNHVVIKQVSDDEFLIWNLTRYNQVQTSVTGLWRYDKKKSFNLLHLTSLLWLFPYLNNLWPQS